MSPAEELRLFGWAIGAGLFLSLLGGVLLRLRTRRRQPERTAVDRPAVGLAAGCGGRSAALAGESSSMKPRLMRYSIALLVVTAFNLANAGLGWLLLRQAGPDLYNVAQLLLGVSGAAAGGWALSLLLRSTVKPADDE